MSPLLTTRRALWWPGLAVLGGAIGIAAVLGLWLGPRSWPLEVGLVAAVLVFLRIGRRERIRRGETKASSRRLRGKRPPTAAPDPAPYDLSRDDSTDGQRWLM